MQTCPPNRVALAWLDVDARAGMRQRFGSLSRVGPACDIDHPRQVPLAIDEEHRVHAVTEPMKPLDRRQARR